MNLKLAAVILLCASVGYAQQTPAAAPTVEQIMNQSIEALGGQAALQSLTSIVMTGTTEVEAYNVSGATTTYAQAPDKFATTTDFENYGTVGRGYDGKTAWNTDPQQGTSTLTGNQLADARIEATFGGALRWKELYPKAEVTGTDKVDGRDCWVVKLTPAEGDPVTRCYDAQTFLPVKTTAMSNTAQGPAQVTIEPSDYRNIGDGVKLPYTLKLNVPGVGDLVIAYQSIKYNVPIDASKFAKPAE